MMAKVSLLLVGLVLGGMFINDKMSEPHASDDKTEIVYGTRVGPDGNVMLVTTR